MLFVIQQMICVLVLHDVAGQDIFHLLAEDAGPRHTTIITNRPKKTNDFIFNNEWFLQVGGTAMSRKFAPNYANLFMAQWEKEALAKCTKQPLCYFRFLGDIFIIWPHSKQDFQDSFNIFNAHHTNIKLTATISENSISFLDVTIFN